jgi:hypothetical protein
MRRRPWSISTTVRNPERLQQFLRVLAEFEGKPFDADVQKSFQTRLIQERLYRPNNIPSELLQRYEDPMHTLSFDEAREIFEHQGYKDPPMRGRQSANPLNKLGLAVAIQRLGKVRITPAGKLLLDNPAQSSEIIFRCLLCCEDARLSSGPCSCADLVELMHAPARPPRRVRNPSSQQSNSGLVLRKTPSTMKPLAIACRIPRLP